MKLIFTTITLIFSITTAFSQLDANALIAVPQASTTDINAISTATITEGSLVFDSTTKKLYEFNGTAWKEILTTPDVVEKTADYTLTGTDNYSVLKFNSATDVTLTIPSGLSTGFNVSVYQLGAGKVTIVGDTGVTVKNRLSRFKTAGVDAGVGIVATDTDVFHITGDLKRN